MDTGMPRPREAADVAAGIRRQIHALAVRAGEGDLEALAELAGLRAHVVAEYCNAVADAHDAGYSFAQLGRALGISKQGAEQHAQKAVGW